MSFVLLKLSIIDIDTYMLLVSISMFLSEFLELADKKAPLSFVQVPFNHPLFIMYSSGTTGPPKCMVHSVGVSSHTFIRVLSCCNDHMGFTSEGALMRNIFLLLLLHVPVGCCEQMV